ncbi:MAG: hypothetical protein CMI08_08290 [Oceanospirillaceae bacterium]|uniref:STAS domain-containing protein n=1 Tax=unclassified Thalassolituus TaxID=2624967 RepID=UPI000C0A0733|nr:MULTISPECIES: STAS domain-containing protein [unclassified Thalassolituus]MAK90685.1 hypothetical protein [Thalassolituus sp.]MAS25174.1 hypothetical protein [Oceanospirillaceae bacterium]MAX99191.1 hypothetical protein [Oceanospirillaceae bacterium]MBL33696.1 hypothetical protein [Oceanospirillaceae bacterium]MBS51694.1 hypothetical protein [Oceanospirillaceae bacterium]|tara:strand:+ start:8660 stop:8950 length:291 start_codon:yes stop_codon:yes gene_type:complete
MTDTITINCGERLSIDQVEALFAETEKSVIQGGEIQIDASKVQFCDTAGLQLLLSLQTTLDKTGHRIHWQGYSDVLVETAGYLGLTQALHLSNTEH